MFFSSKVKRSISLLSAMTLFFSMANTNQILAKKSDMDEGEVLQAFQNPDYSDRPMARMWFPDAGAGIDPYDTIEKQINELAENGWGGVEVTMLSNATVMSIEEAATVGWGTEAWKEVLKKVLRAANATEDGFLVDITMTNHWPIIINAIDPNDDAASQEISYTVTKLTEGQMDDMLLDLELPETKLYDNLGAPFITVDKFISAALVKVDSIQGGTTIYDFDSILDISDAVTAYYGHAAGIPDKKALDTYYFGTEWTVDDIIAEWGNEPEKGADLSDSYNGKMDADSNRLRMADTQYYYSANMTGYDLENYQASDGDELQEGDYVIITTYRRGTGQNLSEGMYPSIQMYGRTFTTNYFISDGIDVVTDYWEKHLLDDELVALMKENGGSIFEDSLEASTSSSFWSQNILGTLEEQNYAYSTEMPVVVALGAECFNSDVANRVITDYNNLLGDLYISEHLTPISEWAASLGYTFRAQAYGLTGVDDGEAATYVDIAEGDNAKKGDGLRLLAGSSNMDDHKYLAMEAVTGMEDSKMNWADIVTEINQNFSHGVNHVVLHGTPYSKSFNGYYGEWPGWVQFDGAHSGSYTYRQAYWEDVSSLTGYISRVQAILATGLAKVDVAVLGAGESMGVGESGNSLQELLDNGYSYNLLSTKLLFHENATIEDGKLYNDGPGYKALIINGLTNLDVEEIEMISDMARDGLPVIFYNCNITNVDGTEVGGNTDDELIERFESIITQKNIYEAKSERDILNIFNKLDIKSEASYEQQMLEATKYVDTEDGSSYYFLFNNSYPENHGMVNPGQSSYYKSGEIIETTVTLTGEGVPYVLDAWTGEIKKVAQYVDNGDGTMTLDVQIYGGDAVIIAFLPDDKSLHAVSVSNGIVVYDGDDLVLQTTTAGAYNVELSDGTQLTGTVEKSLESISLADFDWDLEIISFGPDTSKKNIQSTEVGLGDLNLYEGAVLYKDPSATSQTSVKFKNIQLSDWSEIEATENQLNKLGVESMDQVAGIGYYTTKFFTPDEWSKSTGAKLELTYSQDMVTEIIINGHVIDAVNIVSDTVDIGDYIKPGAANHLSVKLITPMFNRARMEHSVYSEGGMMSWKQSQTIPVGLLDVVVSPYTEIKLMD